LVTRSPSAIASVRDAIARDSQLAGQQVAFVEIFAPYTAYASGDWEQVDQGVADALRSPWIYGSAFEGADYQYFFDAGNPPDVVTMDIYLLQG
jgi:hypothetical protein